MDSDLVLFPKYFSFDLAEFKVQMKHKEKESKLNSGFLFYFLCQNLIFNLILKQNIIKKI